MNAVTVDALAWLNLARCASESLDIFFGPDDELPSDRAYRENAAKRICRRCPVRAACLDDALAAGIRFGVYGGTGEDDRRRLRENLRRRTRASERRAA